MCEVANKKVEQLQRGEAAVVRSLLECTPKAAEVAVKEVFSRTTALTPGIAVLRRSLALSLEGGTAAIGTRPQAGLPGRLLTTRSSGGNGLKEGGAWAAVGDQKGRESAAATQDVRVGSRVHFSLPFRQMRVLLWMTACGPVLEVTTDFTLAIDTRGASGAAGE